MKKKCKVWFPKDLVNERIKEYEDRYVDTYVDGKSDHIEVISQEDSQLTTVKAFEKRCEKEYRR